MTDNQLLDMILSRASKVIKEYNNLQLKNPKIVITQQYGKKLFFAIKFDNEKLPFWIRFTKDGVSRAFILPELPNRLMDWKRSIIKAIQQNCLKQYVEFDLSSIPKEIVHVFFSSFISALNTPGMSIGFMSAGLPELFNQNETYEEVQIESDMMMFG